MQSPRKTHVAVKTEYCSTNRFTDFGFLYLTFSQKKDNQHCIFYTCNVERLAYPKKCIRIITD